MSGLTRKLIFYEISENQYKSRKKQREKTSKIEESLKIEEEK